MNWPSGSSDSKCDFPKEKSLSESLVPEGQKSLLSHFWGHFNYLGVRTVPAVPVSGSGSVPGPSCKNYVLHT